LRCANVVPFGGPAEASLSPDSMTWSPPGALADGITQGMTLLHPVTTSVRLIEPLRTFASALGVNVSVSASQVPLTRGNAATTEEPANASDGDASELLSSVEIFRPAHRCAGNGGRTSDRQRRE